MGEARGGQPWRAQSCWNQPCKPAQHQRIFSLFHQRCLRSSALTACQCASATMSVSLPVWVSGNLGMKEKCCSCIHGKWYSANTTMFTQGSEKWKKAVTHSFELHCLHWQRNTHPPSSGEILCCMTFKKESEQSVQSVTGVKVNQFHTCFLSSSSSEHTEPS